MKDDAAKGARRSAIAASSRGPRRRGTAFAYSVRQHVRFGDIDGAGIVYYPRFFNFFHVAFEEFFGRVARVRYEEVLYKERVGFPIVHVETDFAIPLRHGDAIDVAMTAVRIGRSSFTCRYRVLRRGVLCARADITSATVDLDTMKAIPLPARYREAFEKVREPVDGRPPVT